jgi:two-component system invasion response regulator UvrY
VEVRDVAQVQNRSVDVGYKTVANTCSQIKAKLGVARTADLIRLSIEWEAPARSGMRR